MNIADLQAHKARHCDLEHLFSNNTKNKVQQTTKQIIRQRMLGYTSVYVNLYKKNNTKDLCFLHYSIITVIEKSSIE